MSDFVNSVVHRFKFPDYKLSEGVENAVQALSIDDARAAFEPRLWEDNPNVEQVWFAGVHANVGGGYPKQGMSLITIDWMIGKAEKAGLRFLARDRDFYREHKSVDDKLYDSRSGWGRFYRWKPRDMRALCEAQKAGPRPKVHLSVFERIAYGIDGYAPGTIASHVEVVYTPSGNPEQDRTADARVEAVQSVLAKAFRHGSTSLPRLGYLPGRVTYYLYVSSLVIALVAVLHLATTGWSLKVTDEVILGASIMFLLVSIGAALSVNQRRSRAFSEFWHTSRHELRQGLKKSRERIRVELCAPNKPVLRGDEDLDPAA